MSDPYHQFNAEELIVRDLLAADRTELANERTLLSSVRAALALALAGGSCIHFIDTGTATAVGVGLIVLGIATVAASFARWARLQRMVARIKRGEIGMKPQATVPAGSLPEARPAA